MAASTPIAQTTPQARPILPPPSAEPSSTIKPILRKPGSSVLGVRKRPLDDEDVNGDDTAKLPSSPTKRRKTVMFDENLNVVTSIGAGKTVDEARRHIILALDERDRNDGEEYDRIKAIFAPHATGAEDDETEDALPYVVALTGLGKRVGRQYPGLVKSVLRCSWLERDDNFVHAYIQLLAALSSIQTSTLGQVLAMMVGKFIKEPTTCVEGFPLVNGETRKERLHLGLRYLLEVFPAAGELILKHVEKKFPYTDEPKEVHMTYIRHLLQLRAERSELERDIMELVLSHLVKLDVEMALDLENEDDDTTRAVMRQLAATSGDGSGEDAESDAESVVSVDYDEDDEQTRRITIIKGKLETMDATLDLLFSIYSPMFEDPDSPEALTTFQDLLSDFSNVVLPNLKSRHTQYLLFKFATKSHQFMDLFIGTLLNIAHGSDLSLGVKQSAVGYLASLTARSAQLESEQVQKIARTFLDYIDYYRTKYSHCRGPDVGRYGQYYASFQGLLYIFCFRWRDLIDRDSAPPNLDWDDTASFIGQDLPWVPWLKPRLQANIASKLNPLRCCSPIIVDEFARLSHHLRLMYIYPQIEKNKKNIFTSSHTMDGTRREVRIDNGEGENWNHLEACFPFDPFQLPVSKRWLDLDETYISWQRFALLEREDETDRDAELSEGTSDDEDTDDDEDGISIEDDTATDDGTQDG